MTNKELVGILSEVIGTQIGYQGFSPDVMRAQSEDMAKMYEWFDTTGYKADIQGLRRDFPEVAWHSFKTWAQRVNWEHMLAVAPK